MHVPWKSKLFRHSFGCASTIKHPAQEEEEEEEEVTIRTWLTNSHCVIHSLTLLCNLQIFKIKNKYTTNNKYWKNY